MTLHIHTTHVANAVRQYMALDLDAAMNLMPSMQNWTKQNSARMPNL
jgi:hypothetical protein